MPPRYVSAPELAAACAISVKTLRRWIVAGQIAKSAGVEGGRRKWPVALAAAEVERLGFVVPTDWRQAVAA